ncbi:GAF and ANTAR domain-containing protein [Streptomyces sp. NPDC057403]|uniref:GAF and ANTAR domain-containing protein n=1 Tax=Streptomyces sp. NPDC057403 TaxID=3346119 RepID=UPI00369B4B94
MRSGDDREGFFGGAPGPGDDRAPAEAVIAEGLRGARPEEVPGRLCAALVDLLPVSGASVCLRSEGLPVRISASDDAASYLAELQATVGEGPGMLAARLGATVLACDLTAGHDTQRWPVFAHQATAAGVAAVYALPLGVDALCVGTLELYRGTPGELTERQLRTARRAAGLLTEALVTLPWKENAERGDEPWVCGLAADHDEINQAVGMIMAQLGADAAEALDRLRGHAFVLGRTVLDVARDVVARRTRFDGEL